MKSFPVSVLLALALSVTALSLGYIVFNASGNAPLTLVQSDGQVAQVSSSLSSGLIAHLPFDGSSLADASGNGNSGSWSGSPSFTSGKIGDGSASVSAAGYVVINNKVYSTSGGSVAFWFKKNGSGNLTGSYGGSGNQRAPTLSISPSGTLTWEFGGATANETGVAIDNNWHHVVMTYTSSGAVRVYLDGSRIVNKTATNPGDFFNQVHIGHYGNFGSSFGNSSVDDFRIYNRVLSGSEITSLYSYTGATVDTTAPSISNVTASSITTTEASITWTTNEPADTYVDFGVTSSYGSHSTLKDTGNGMVTSHLQNIVNLQPNTTYNYRVTSKDAAGNVAVSGNGTFTTLAPPNAQPTVSLSSSVPTAFAPAAVTFTAAAADSDGSIARVEFYNGSSLLVSDSSAPYSYAWSNIAAGTYAVTARAYDNMGASVISTPVTITVTPAPVAMSDKFKVGDKVQVNDTSANVRSSGALSASLRGTQPMYSVATVLGGGAQNPTDKFFWWDLDFQTGVDGYMGEGTLNATTISTAYKIGDRVQTKNPTNVRSAPLISATTLLGTQADKVAGTIVKGGMLDAGGTFSWWYVDYDSGVDGFSGEDNLQMLSNTPADVTAPSTPSNLTATAASVSQ
ncbi:MAG: LamG-like jellyroll fold domain-containing protein, partial [Patescibacteria group bacterium]